MAIFVSRLGPAVISAHQIVANLTSLCYMVPLSAGIASSVLIAQSLGAGWPAVAEIAMKRTLRLTLSIAVLAFISSAERLSGSIPASRLFMISLRRSCFSGASTTSLTPCSL